MYCEGVNRPISYVPKANGVERFNYFLKNKYGPLTDYLGKPETLSTFYPAFHFIALLDRLLTADGVRIYIASYPDEREADVPSGLGNCLTLIYAPVTLEGGKFKDKRNYFILNPRMAVKELSIATASQWVRNYQDRKLPILTAVAELDSDTTSIVYTKAHLDSIKKEIDCQPATGVRACFASYTDTENIATIPVKHHKRLIVQFILTENRQGIERDFYIDERPGWEHRKPAKKADADIDPFILDTGSPCPPDNCDGYLPA